MKETHASIIISFPSTIMKGNCLFAFLVLVPASARTVHLRASAVGTPPYPVVDTAHQSSNTLVVIWIQLVILGCLFLANRHDNHKMSMHTNMFGAGGLTAIALLVFAREGWFMLMTAEAWTTAWQAGGSMAFGIFLTLGRPFSRTLKDDTPLPSCDDMVCHLCSDSPDNKAKRLEWRPVQLPIDWRAAAPMILSNAIMACVDSLVAKYYFVRKAEDAPSLFAVVAAAVVYRGTRSYMAAHKAWVESCRMSPFVAWMIHAVTALVATWVGTMNIIGNSRSSSNVLMWMACGMYLGMGAIEWSTACLGKTSYSGRIGCFVAGIGLVLGCLFLYQEDK